MPTVGRFLLSSALGIATIGFAVVTLVTLVKVVQLSDRMSVDVEESVIWASAQVEVELARLLADAGSADAADPEAVGLVQQRFDILWSRVGLLEGGVFAAWLVREPELGSTVTAIRAALRDFDEPMLALPEGAQTTLPALVQRFAPLGTELRRLSVASVHEDRRQRAELRALHDDLSSGLVASALATAAAGSTLILFLVLNVRNVRRLLRLAQTAGDEARQARQRLEEAIENINEGFVLLDRDDRLVMCNSTYRRLYELPDESIVPGVAFEEILRLGVDAGQYADAEADPEAWVAQRLALRRENTPPFEQPLADGRWLLVSDRRTQEGGMVGIRSDITELKRRQLALEEAQQRLESQAARMQVLVHEAEAASAAKSEFLAMMSHEIRTPLNGVLGALGLLSDRMDGEEEHRLLRTARQSGESLLTLLNDLLDVSKAEAGKLDLEQSVFAPAALAATVVDIGRLQARPRGLDVTLNVQEDVPAWVRGDAGRIRQMLLNLVSNAVKFTEQGNVRVVLRRPSSIDSRIVRFEVIDDGIGIARDRQEAIFADFMQADASTAQRYGGSGLGLAITKRLANMMGGEVFVESVPGVGSRFWIDVPLEAAPVPEGATKAETSQDDLRPFETKPRILVAEDNSANQIIARAMLERLGCHVDMVGDGAEAVTAAASLPYDAIILDLSMPIMDGEEAARRLRGAGFLGPVIVATAHASLERADRLKTEGVDEVLVKPLDRGRLRAVLAEGLQRSAAAPMITAASSITVDEKALRRLRDDIGEEALLAVIAQSAVDLETAAHDVQSALLAGDETALKPAAHRIAGVAASVGGDRVADTARDVERQGTASQEIGSLVGDTMRLAAHLRDMKVAEQV